MRFITPAAAVLALSLAVAPAAPAAAAPAAVCQQLVPPAYGPAVWAGSQSSSPVPANVIANWGQGYDGAGGGPGLSKNPADLTIIRRARARGIQILGYVWTDYANNAAGNAAEPGMTPAPLSAAENEAMQWYEWYGVRDVFFDGATTGLGNGQLSYYRSLYAYVRQHIPGGRVWINPGWYPVSAAYMSAADVVMDFEGSYDTLAANPPPGWVYGFPAGRFATVLQLPDGESADLGAALSLTRADNVGHVFVADQPDYSALPAYWSAEDAAVAAECGA
jgi:Spherulation-specific family 4